jgi:large subunit ribosomal protein L6
MSRIAKSPIGIPSGVDVAIDGQTVNVKGSKGSLSHNLHASVEIRNEDGTLLFAARENTKPAVAQAGTARALVNNMVTGVSQGFERKLTLVGVGYRAQMQGTSLNLALFFPSR